MFAARFLMGISLAALTAGTAWAQTNTTQYNQTGTGNQATVDNTVEGNVGNSTVIIQNGVNNSATVFQRGEFNQSFMEQIGVGNRSTHQQAGSNNSAAHRQYGDFHLAVSSQVGTLNSSTVLQVGEYNTSTVRQGYALDQTVPLGEDRAADFNSANVDQNGSGLRSIISQRGASTSSPAANSNNVFVVQRSSGFGELLQQFSEITQESVSNYAEVLQQQGSIAAPNSSTIVQRNNVTPAAASLNSASVIQTGQNLSSGVVQDGLRNTATVRMTGGGSSAADAVSGQISQTGTDLRAVTRFGGRSTGGVGNVATVTQTGTGHNVETYHFGFGDRSSISQANGVNTGGEARARAFVSQNATSASSTINQTGDNYAEVVQALGSNITTEIAQVDAGDVGATRASNSIIVSQYGTANTATVQQNAIDANASIWQRTGSTNNSLAVGQGTGGTGLASTTGTPGFVAGPTGAGSINLDVVVTQGGSYNDATVYQDGTSLQSDVEQSGIGTAALRNIVFVSQSGTSNTATAVQGSGVGPSNSGDPASGNSAAQNGGAQDEFYFGGGARSAEIRILQTNNGNSASIAQYGDGQYGRIEQSGSGNTADIVQQDLATNATAVIRQTGNANSFYVVQNAPGQYISVQQAGNGNVATNVVTRGDTGGYSGFTPAPGS